MRNSLVCLILAWALPVSALEITSTGGSQYTINDLEGFRMQKTEHFEIYYQKTRPSSTLTKSFEKSWKVASTFLPNQALIFDTGNMDAQVEFNANGTIKRTSSSRASSSKTTPFKIKYIFVKDRGTYQQMSLSLAGPEMADRARQYIQHISTFTVDGTVRICWQDSPMLKSSGAPVHFSHLVASDVLRIHQGVSTPFWLDAGFSYTVEFALNKKSVTSYLDYQSYYNSYDGAGGGDSNVSKTETFQIGRPWAPVIKQHMKKEKVGEISQVFVTDTSNLDPLSCGYVYAFSCFLMSDLNKAKKFNQFILKMKDSGGTGAEDLLLEAYDYKDLDSMQSDWHKYMRSSKFR